MQAAVLPTIESAARAIKLARRGIAPAFEDSVLGDLAREELVQGLPLWLSTRRGWVYLATNEAWPGLYKVGCTRKTVAQRLSELSGTGVATPWVRLRSWGAYDAYGLESLAHQACAPWCVRGELFSGSPHDLAAAISQALKDDRKILMHQLGRIFVPGHLDELLDAASGMVGAEHRHASYTS